MTQLKLPTHFLWPMLAIGKVQLYGGSMYVGQTRHRLSGRRVVRARTTHSRHVATVHKSNLRKEFSNFE